VFQQGTISTICHEIWNKSIGSRTFDPRRPGSSAAKQAKTKVFLGFTWQAQLSKLYPSFAASTSRSFVFYSARAILYDSGE